MKYYVKYNNGKVVSIGVNNGDIEITKEEYETLLAEIREKASLVDQLYKGEIAIEDVPADWQEEIQRRVDGRIAAEGEAAEQDIPAEEALSIILGGETA